MFTEFFLKRILIWRYFSVAVWWWDFGCGGKDSRSIRHSFLFTRLLLEPSGHLNNAIEDYNLRFVSSGSLILSAPRSLRLF